MSEHSGARFVIWGSAGHALVLSALLRGEGAEIVALVDNDAAATSVLPGVPLLHGWPGLEAFLAAHTGGPLSAVVAIGGGRGGDRRELLRLFSDLGLATPSLRHPRSFVCDTAIIGPGCHVLANAVVAAEALLGEGCIVNHGAVVDHECRIGAGTHVGPGATLCGCVTTGDDVFVGAGAVVLPRLELGRRCVVGAGAVVTADVPEQTMVVGNPARPRPRA